MSENLEIIPLMIRRFFKCLNKQQVREEDKTFLQKQIHFLTIMNEYIKTKYKDSDNLLVQEQIKEVDEMIESLNKR